MSIGINWDETWVGLGIKVGGQLGIGGAESTFGQIFNMGNPSYKHRYTIESDRTGLGMGGGFDFSLMMVFRAKALYWIDNHFISDWGINIAMGKKWGDLIKILNPENVKILRLLVKHYHVIQHVDSLRDLASMVYNTLELNTSTAQHPILNVEIPGLGHGLEISAFKSKGKISLYDTGTLGGKLVKRSR